MERQILHGSLKPVDIAHALMAEFNRGNLQAQTVGQADKIAVQIATRHRSLSGGQTALTVSIQTVEDGVMVEIGEQAWLGVAASLGATALSAIRNPFSLLGRLDDLAQDIESMSLKENIWKSIDRAARSLKASREFSEKVRRIPCPFCNTANPLGEASCSACGAPLGDEQLSSCNNCGFAVSSKETHCPNCNTRINKY